MATTLPLRLQRLLQHTCDLYKPEQPAPVTTGSIEAKDRKLSMTKAASGVLCYYEPTPEFDQPAPPGITKQNSLLTADKWHFAVDAEIFDAWMIVMRTPGHPYNGRVWIVQGNSFVNGSTPSRPADSQWCFARLQPTMEIPTS